MNRKILVTGGAGFIGSHLVNRLLSSGDRVTVVDNLDPFYDPAIKRRNLKAYSRHPGFQLLELDIRDVAAMKAQVPDGCEIIVHLAAKVAVRNSIEDPMAYQDVNVCGTQSLLELAKFWGVKQFVFASSSSVYGLNPNVPWRESDNLLLPISPYASTKVSGELLGHVYSHLYNIRFVALRFFTVYGPRQRPDLAIHKLGKLMLAGKPIPFFGDGSTRRDYTYVDDVINGLQAAIEFSASLYAVFNIGNNQTVSLAELVSGLEHVLGVEAKIHRYADQLGDVPQTWADVSQARRCLGYEPQTNFRQGLRRFADWLKSEKDNNWIEPDFHLLSQAC